MKNFAPEAKIGHWHLGGWSEINSPETLTVGPGNHVGLEQAGAAVIAPSRWPCVAGE